MQDIEELQGLAVEHARELGLKKLSKNVTVAWNPRMRSTAGRAFYKEDKIELNPKLLEISTTELHRTFLHELAHLVAHHRSRPRRIAPHGVQWQQACADLDIPGEKATHSLPLPSRKLARPWLYTCPSCQQTTSRARRMKNRNRVACYPCCKAYNSAQYSAQFKLVESFQEATS